MFGFLSVSYFLFAVPEPLIKLSFVEARLVNEFTEYFFVPATLIFLEVANEESHLVVSLAVLRVGFPEILASDFLFIIGFVSRLILFGTVITLIRNEKDRVFLVAIGPSCLKKLCMVHSFLVGSRVTFGEA